MGPTTPTPALNSVKKSMILSACIYLIFTPLRLILAGLPGMSIPAGFVNDLPVGIAINRQFI